MRKNILLSLVITTLIVGCGDNNKQANQASNSNQAKSTQDKNSSNSSRLMASKASKGNLWLAIFEGNFSRASSLGQIIYSSDFDSLPNDVEGFLKRSAGDNGQFDLSTVRKSKGVPTTFALLLTVKGEDPKSIEDYKKIIAKLKALQPEMPELDKAGESFAQSYIELAQAWGAVGDYYRKSEEYKLDDFAKAPELYNNLLAAYKNYAIARRQASIAYGKLYDELHAAQKQELKAKGYNVAYNVYESLDVAQEIVDILHDTYKQKGNFKNFDKALLEKKLAQLEAAVNELKPVKGKKQEISREGLRHLNFDSYVDSFASFIVQTKVVLRDLDEKNIESELDTLYSKFKTISSKYNDII